MARFTTSEPIAVTIELSVGDVWLVATDRADTVVDVQPTNPSKESDVAAAEQTRVEYANGSLLIRAPKGWRKWAPWGGSESIDVRIQLPTGSCVRAGAGVGALRSTGRFGECRYHTGMGDIQLESTGPVELKSGAGDVTVDAVSGKAEITTAGRVRVGRIDGPAVVKNRNGDTWVGEIAGDARVNAANGAISIDMTRETASVKTANGDVRLGEVSHGVVVAQSAFGTVEVGVRDGVAAWLDLETKYGTVQNDLDPTEEPGQGTGTVEVRARTSMGNIIIHRSFASATGRDEA